MDNSTHYFLGANSGQGFQSLFERFCRVENHYDLLILKGGPGCGKSTMMKKIGAAMEARGEQVEYLHCSGDPDSLDGVHIPRIRTAVVDGTAPHVIEPRYPAAVDRYVDLGRFYDIESAKNTRDDVIRFSDACSEAYRSAYRALSAASQIEKNASELIARELDHQKLRRRTEGIIAREIRGKGCGGEDRYRFLGSITYKGQLMLFDSLFSHCTKVFQLIDPAGLAASMLAEIYRAAHERRYAAVVCPDPECTALIQHLLIPELSLAFISFRKGMECSCEPYRRIHLDSMISGGQLKPWKGKLKLMRKLSYELKQEGVGHLREAKAAHDALESVYQSNVDFSGVDELTEYELKKILKY